MDYDEETALLQIANRARSIMERKGWEDTLAFLGALWGQAKRDIDWGCRRRSCKASSRRLIASPWIPSRRRSLVSKPTEPQWARTSIRRRARSWNPLRPRSAQASRTAVIPAPNLGQPVVRVRMGRGSRSKRRCLSLIDCMGMLSDANISKRGVSFPAIGGLRASFCGTSPTSDSRSSAGRARSVHHLHRRLDHRLWCAFGMPK